MGKAIASRVCALTGHDIKSLQVTSNVVEPKTQIPIPKFEIRCAKCALPLAECERDQRPHESRERKRGAPKKDVANEQSVSSSGDTPEASGSTEAHEDSGSESISG